ncbi:uncharacterized protein PGTG_01080 [Puccinia graminis f. sp. tritici CRL 75-36-700-3]|uniref:Uncharacterized protein n=1 Tax=Puccinia graminis f. sp. tritici (strain CRL 75-36-700-3 / race SCCL) TaxID=418459 RepID=E3JUM4_PUCGT|nr:uncharacterized protein PGTG_01080 [Puccinia graminis f. sp. tritici CRL 75-36-700-3]EFP75749.2 hypothetical protein PGTG_01080 [Puccinia graminis f. sp. tritici CRL 75-36-700-3]
MWALVASPSFGGSLRKGRFAPAWHQALRSRDLLLSAFTTATRVDGSSDSTGFPPAFQQCGQQAFYPRGFLHGHGLVHFQPTADYACESNGEHNKQSLILCTVCDPIRCLCGSEAIMGMISLLAAFRLAQSDVN